MPIRIQRQRKKGWKKPPGAVNCTRPGKYGNPFKIGDPGIATAEDAQRAYLIWLQTTVDGRIMYYDIKLNLPGKDLMCFCKLSEACHVDVILKIANEK